MDTAVGCVPEDGPRERRKGRVCMKWSFLGGASEVTGSKHLLEMDGGRILFDCGMYQGKRKEADRINRQLGVTAGTVDAVVVSHAHIDHCGCIPLMTREGYQGPIYATSATADLLPVMLRDSANIQESDAAYLNQKTNRKGLPPVIPLYTMEDAETSFGLIRSHEYGQVLELPGGVRLVHMDAGHILGAALARMEIPRTGKSPLRLGMAVDLGRRNLPLLQDPQQMADLDVLICESTYGDRLHDNAQNAAEGLRVMINRVIERGGKVMIPTFALERAQEVIYHLASLFARKEIPRVPVYMDSPMAQAVTHVFEKNRAYLDAESEALRLETGESLLTPSWLTFAESVDDSKGITSSKEPSIVLAAAGMCEHGRILHHLKHGIENEANGILLVGYQAVNTLGRRLQNGEKKVKIFGDEFSVKAEVDTLHSFSAHADRLELYRYISDAKPRKLVLVHGEQDQRESLAKLVEERMRIPVLLPMNGDATDFEDM